MKSRRPSAHASPTRALAALILAALLAALAAPGCGGGEEAADAPSPTPAAPAGGLTTATPTPEATIDPALTGEEREAAVWGARACALARDFASDFLASGDPRDPTELPLAERKVRAAAMFPAQFAAVDAALDELALFEPPERTAELHELLRQTYEGLRDTLRDQQAIIAAASSSDEIAFSNLEVNEWLNLALRQAQLLQSAGYC